LTASLSQSKEKLYLLSFENFPIFEQLQLEEALLRLTDKNWCLLNRGSPPAIVMGISGKQEELVCPKKMRSAPLPLLRRYSGGGTVVVDHNTLFVSFIFQKKCFPFPCFPEPILRWSERFYQEALQVTDFHLRENDYVIGDHKCGGNAQYIKKESFVHHTTFLWDFEKERMDYLLYPKKSPNYRSNRPHHHFLRPLKGELSSQELFFDRIKEELAKRYVICFQSKEALASLLEQPHRRATLSLNGMYTERN